MSFPFIDGEYIKLEFRKEFKKNFMNSFSKLKNKKFIFFFLKLGRILKIILELDKKKIHIFFPKLGRFLRKIMELNFQNKNLNFFYFFSIFQIKKK